MAARGGRGARVCWRGSSWFFISSRGKEEGRGGAVAWWRGLGDGTVARERKTTRERWLCWAAMALGPKREEEKKRWARSASSLFRTFQDFSQFEELGKERKKR